jgi:hypothetical protein
VRLLTTDRLAGAVLAVLALAALRESLRRPLGTIAEPGPGSVPVLLAAILLVCSLVVIGGGAGAPAVTALPWGEWRHALAILGTCAFMALALERLGYRLTTFVAILALVTFVEGKGWIAGLFFALGFSLGSHYLFATLLRVPMPGGPFGF